jgi:hypothetical protein
MAEESILDYRTWCKAWKCRLAGGFNPVWVCRQNSKHL